MKEATDTVPHTRREINLTPADVERFWRKVNKNGPIMPNMETPCWQWMTGKSDSGYGSFAAGGRTLKTHRIAWTLAKGQIPHDGSAHGICVCHRCDNPLCVNPAHLFLGAHIDNMRDMGEKGRKVVARGDKHHSRLRPERMARGDRNGARTHPERVRCGDEHVSAKLTAEKVLAIRTLHAAGGVSKSELGRQFDVSHNLIGYIIRRKIWKHI